MTKEKALYYKYFQTSDYHHPVTHQIPEQQHQISEVQPAIQPEPIFLYQTPAGSLLLWKMKPLQIHQLRSALFISFSFN
jgi:hypothetical protein